MIFFRTKREYFLELIGVHEFFSFNLCTSSNPPTYPHKFSNGPSLRALEWTSGMGTKFRQNPFGLADTNTVHYVSSFINVMSGI